MPDVTSLQARIFCNRVYMGLCVVGILVLALLTLLIPRNNPPLFFVVWVLGIVGGYILTHVVVLLRNQNRRFARRMSCERWKNAHPV